MSAVARESNRSPGPPEWLPTRHCPNRPRPVSRIPERLVSQSPGCEAVAAISRGLPLAIATRRPGRRTVAFGCPMPTPAPVARSRRRTSRRSPVARLPGADHPTPGRWLPSTGLRRPDVPARSLSTRTDGCPLRDRRFDYYAGVRIAPFTFSPSACKPRSVDFDSRIVAGQGLFFYPQGYPPTFLARPQNQRVVHRRSTTWPQVRPQATRPPIGHGLALGLGSLLTTGR